MISPCRNISGLIQPHTNPHWEIPGHLFLCIYSPFFFFSPANKLAMVLLLRSVLFTPQRAKGQLRYRPTGATWRCCTEEFLAHPGHKHSSFMGLASCRMRQLSLRQTRAPLSFLPLLLPGSEQNQEQGENALERKIKMYRSSRQIALPVTKVHPEVQLGFLNHVIKRQEKPTGASVSSTELMPKPPVVPGWLLSD